MQIFLPWSGNRSKAFAKLLDEILPKFHKSIRPRFSETALPSGREWRKRLLAELRQSDACVISLTRDVLESTWVHFEVGAIAAQAKKPVCTLLLDMPVGELAELAGPLEQYHAHNLDKDGLAHLMKALNGSLPRQKRLSLTQVLQWVDAHWPEVRDPDKDPIGELFRLPHAADAAYLLASAAEVCGKKLKGYRERAAIWELIDQITILPNENTYLGEVTDIITRSSVWAICGQKTRPNRQNFYQANVESRLKGHHIERIFFPPDSKAEASSICDAIKVHLEHPRLVKRNVRMVVRAFSNETGPKSARNAWHFPIGFGMTLMGMQDAQLDGRGNVKPRNLEAVLIHWGDVDNPALHRGVILREREWTWHFWDLFKKVRSASQLVEAKTWDEFLAKHHRYGSKRPRRRT